MYLQENYELFDFEDTDLFQKIVFISLVVNLSKF